MSQPAENKTGDSRAMLGEVKPLQVPERPQVSAPKANAKALRRQRGRRLALRLALFVLLPSALATIYFVGVASPQFESHATFTVQSSETRPSFGVSGLLAGLADGGGGSHDALVVRDYALSRDMLTRLAKERGFIAHYKNRSADFISRLNANASFEEAYDYFGHKVTCDYDSVSGAVTVHVRAFSPEQAVSVTTAILSYSEEMVNKLSERERRDRTAYAEAGLKKAEERLTAARKVIVSLQQEHSDFNPVATATSLMTIRTGLEVELAKARAEVMQLRSYMQDDAPQLRAANERVKAISAQVAGESRRLVDPAKPGGLNSSFSDFEAAMVEKEFAQKAYESSMAMLEIARADADRQHRYVAIIAAPSKPDEATYPHRIRSVLTSFLVCFLLWGTISMMTAAVREHARL
jgi:capsular polysaccharide transport system permease protein